MAYTRGSAPRANVQHMDDGELGPRPTPATAAPDQPPPIVRYLFNRQTAQRNMEAFELFLLIDRLLGPLELSVPAEEINSVHPDLRRHLRPVRG